MSPKELAYIEDALGHEQFLQKQCEAAATQVTDSQLKMSIRQMADKHQQIFQQFYNLV